MDTRFLGLIETSIKAHWALPVFSDINGATYHYNEFARKMEELHLLLEKAGIATGERIAIVGSNSAHWAISFFATLTYGAVAVPILHEFNTDNIHHIVRHSESKVLFVSASGWRQLYLTAMPGVVLVIRIDDFAVLYSQIPEMAAYVADIPRMFGEKYPDFTPESIHYFIEQPDDLAVLSYTSGTTSSSKGVMIPYRSLWSNTLFAADNLGFIHAGDPIVCLLPMAHMYGLAFEVLNSVNKGCHIHFINGKPVPSVVLKAFQTYHPRLVLAVPLIIEKIVKAKIFPIIQKSSIKLLLQVPIVNALIRKKIKKQIEEAFGGAFEEVVLGGAALSKEVEQFLHSIRFRYTVGYGMTECGPLIAYAQWDRFKPESVGRVVDRMEVRIDSPNPQQQVGEIWVRGTNNMLGYYKNPEETAAVMADDGWMKTGDLGILDHDGNLFIKGRCKTMILSSNGQNIYPEEIENKLNNMPLVVESLVVSDNVKLRALIYLDWKQIEQEQLTDEKLNAIIKGYLAQVNKSIPRYCQLSQFTLMKEAFEKTPKQSIRRFLYQPKTED